MTECDLGREPKGRAGRARINFLECTLFKGDVARWLRLTRNREVMGVQIPVLVVRASPVWLVFLSLIVVDSVCSPLEEAY